MKLKSGDLVTPSQIAPALVELYDQEPCIFTDEGLTVKGYIKKGECGLVLSSNSDSTVVCVLSPGGTVGYSFGAVFTKVTKLYENTPEDR